MIDREHVLERGVRLVVAGVKNVGSLGPLSHGQMPASEREISDEDAEQEAEIERQVEEVLFEILGGREHLRRVQESLTHLSLVSGP